MVSRWSRGHDPAQMLINRGESVLQPARVRVGFCPKCQDLLVVVNNHESWPLVRCGCGWAGMTTQMPGSIRLERGGKVTVDARADMSDWGVQ